MTPSHTSKGGKRYRYYITHPSSMITSSSPAWRISATEVERIVIERLVQWLGNRSAIMSLVGSDAAAAALAKAKQAAMDVSASRQRIAGLLIGKAQVDHDRITLHLNRAGVAAALGTTAIEDHAPLQLTAHTTRIRQGKDVRMIISDEDRSAGTVNQPLVALLSEAQLLHQGLFAKPEHSIASLADALGKCRRRSAALIRIALLAPDIVASCIDGTQPVTLTTKLLLNADLPISWQKQRALLGFV